MNSKTPQQISLQTRTLYENRFAPRDGTLSSLKSWECSGLMFISYLNTVCTKRRAQAYTIKSNVREPFSHTQTKWTHTHTTAIFVFDKAEPIFLLGRENCILFICAEARTLARNPVNGLCGTWTQKLHLREQECCFDSTYMIFTDPENVARSNLCNLLDGDDDESVLFQIDSFWVRLYWSSGQRWKSGEWMFEMKIEW